MRATYKTPSLIPNNQSSANQSFYKFQEPEELNQHFAGLHSRKYEGSMELQDLLSYESVHLSHPMVENERVTKCFFKPPY